MSQCAPCPVRSMCCETQDISKAGDFRFRTGLWKKHLDLERQRRWGPFSIIQIYPSSVSLSVSKPQHRDSSSFSPSPAPPTRYDVEQETDFPPLFFLSLSTLLHWAPRVGLAITGGTGESGSRAGRDNIFTGRRRGGWGILTCQRILCLSRDHICFGNNTATWKANSTLYLLTRRRVETAGSLKGLLRHSC